MEVVYEIKYHELVVKKDIPKLSSSIQARIKRSIEDKLTSHPEIFGKPLKHSARGYRKLRVGDYRVIFRINGEVINIFVIGHRSWIYESIEHRLP